MNERAPHSLPITLCSSLFSPPTVLCLILAVVLAGARLRTYHEPLEWDIGTYTTAAGELLQGRQLYADAWDVKPPGIFLTFAAAQAVLPDVYAASYALSVIAAIVTMLAIYRAGAIAGREAGAWAAAFWCTLCFAPQINGNLPNTEVFINVAVAWAFVLWLRGSIGEDRRAARWLAIGVLFAVASLYKQVAIAPAACLGAFELIAPPSKVRRRIVLARLCLILAPVVLIWSATFAYFAATGRGWLIWQTLVVYPRAYAGSPLANVAASMARARLLPRVLLFATPAAVLALIAVGSISHDFIPRRALALLIALVIGTQLAVALPGAFAEHYYQLWFVPLAVVAGWGAFSLTRLVHRSVFARIACMVAVIAIVAPQLPWYSLDAREFAWRQHGVFFRWANEAVERVGARLLPNETIFSWSDEAWIYSKLNRGAPGPTLWKYHATQGPLAGYLTDRTLGNLRGHPPALVISWGEPEPKSHPIVGWIKQNYDPVDDPRRANFPLQLLVLRNSPLQRRLRESAATGSPAR